MVRVNAYFVLALSCFGLARSETAPSAANCPDCLKCVSDKSLELVFLHEATDSFDNFLGQLKNYDAYADIFASVKNMTHNVKASLGIFAGKEGCESEYYETCWLGVTPLTDDFHKFTGSFKYSPELLTSGDDAYALDAAVYAVGSYAGLSSANAATMRIMFVVTNNYPSYSAASDADLPKDPENDISCTGSAVSADQVAKAFSGSGVKVVAMIPESATDVASKWETALESVAKLPAGDRAVSLFDVHPARYVDAVLVQVGKLLCPN